MKRVGPDSLNSWLIAGACCFINMMMYGMARLSGILFVAATERFNVSREQASFPFTFDNFMRNTSGPLVGYLGHKFGVRAVTTFGCLLGAIGAGTCYFAENINTVTGLWGVLYGLGFGLGSILLPVSINQYFDKRRASGSGIALSGACLGSFLLPPIVEVLLNRYGLSGTFLFLSGFLLNCVPAALLLKKPDFEIDSPQFQDLEKSETQSITSGMKVKLYTEENNSEKPPKYEKVNSYADLASKSESDNISRQDSYEKKVKSNFTPEEGITEFSTKALLSQYSTPVSASEYLDADGITGKSKDVRQADLSVVEAEVLSLSSNNTYQDLNSEKDKAFKKNMSSSARYDKKSFTDSLDKLHTISCESLVPEKGKRYPRNFKEVHQNYAYKTDFDAQTKKYFSPNFISKNNIQKSADLQSSNNGNYFNDSYQRNIDNFNIPPEHYKNSEKNPTILSRSSENSEIDNLKVKNEDFSLSEKVIPKNEEKSCLGPFSIILDPTFILIAITNAIYNFTFVCMITIVVDFARDLNIGTSNEKYILMTLSVGDLIGRLGLGWITDNGYMTSTGFAAVCLACQGIVTTAIVFADGFISLMILVTLYGLSESGVIVIYPVIIAQYIDKDKQTVAIPSSNFLSGPLCLVVAPLIGYFRDRTGAYDNIFYCVGLLSVICSICLTLMPYLRKCRRKY